MEYILNQSTANYGRISNSIEISLVGRVPDCHMQQMPDHIQLQWTDLNTLSVIRWFEKVSFGTFLRSPVIQIIEMYVSVFHHQT